MLRIVLSGVVGGIVFFVWGFLVHMVLDFHAGTIRALPDQESVRAHLQTEVPETGAYFFPMPELTDGMTTEQREQAREVWGERTAAGPTGVLFIRKEGAPPMSPMTYITGLSIFMLLCVIASMNAGLAGTALNTFVRRWFFFMGIGLIVVLFGDISAWNWWHLPNDYTQMMVLDHLIGWALAGAAMAAIIRPAGRSTDAAPAP